MSHFISLRYLTGHLLIILALSLLAVRQLPYIGYFETHDDVTPFRQVEMHKCFLDKQLPCRWVPDMGNGFGYPLFNYYPPLPYFVGEIFILLGTSVISAVKISFFLSLFLSGVSIYLLIKRIFSPLSALVAAIFYIWVPYRAVDVYVRGALNESWSFVFLPLILLFTYELLLSSPKDPLAKLLFIPKTKFVNSILLAVSWSGLLLSHNVITLIFFPFYFIWILVITLIFRSYKSILFIISGSFLGFCLAGFFTIPSFFEQNLVWLDITGGYFDFREHYATLKQLFISRFWGYGLSFSGEGDGMSFQIGHLHWILSLIGFCFLIIDRTKLIFRKSIIHLSKNNQERREIYLNKKTDLIGGAVFLLALLAIYMTTGYSKSIWELFPILAVVQFPWRFLTISSLFICLSCGYFIDCFKNHKIFSSILTSAVIIVVVAINWQYFLPGKTVSYADLTLFNHSHWKDVSGYSLKDYLPKTSPGTPGVRGDILVVPGDINTIISGTALGTNWFKFKVTSYGISPVIVNVLQFPFWTIYIDNYPVISTVDPFGRIQFNVPDGFHTVSARLTDTTIRTFSNTLSLIAVIFTILPVCYMLIATYGPNHHLPPSIKQSNDF